MKRYLWAITFILSVLGYPDTGAAQNDIPLPPPGPIGQEQVLTEKIYAGIPAPQPAPMSFERNPFASKLPPPPKPEELDTPYETDLSGIQRPQTPPDFQERTQPEQQAPAQISIPEMEITGLVWNTDRPQAIVNGKVIDVGDDLLNNTVVTAIHKDGIEISVQGHSVVIKSGKTSETIIQIQDMSN